MAMNIVEYAKTNPGTVVRDAIIDLYAMNSDILLVLPFIDIPGGSYSYRQEDTLPGIGFRGINEEFETSNGVVNPETEQLTIAGGNVDVDVALLRFHGDGRRAVEREMKIKALSHAFTNKFIKGDSEADPREFDGLQKRLTGAQVISNDETSGGGGLSLAKLDELIDAVDNPNYLLMSKASRRKLTQAARSTDVGGYITFEQDAFGRKQTFYSELPILLSDKNGTQGATLQYDETYTGGGTANGTSIYCLELGEARLSGIQNGGIEVEDHGRHSGGNLLRDTVEWYTGIALEHPRAAARLRDISDAAATA